MLSGGGLANAARTNKARHGSAFICSPCGNLRAVERYGSICADDLPPYLTILVVGHIIVLLFMLTDRLLNFLGSVHGAIWLPVTIVLMSYFCRA